MGMPARGFVPGRRRGTAEDPCVAQPWPHRHACRAFTRSGGPGVLHVVEPEGGPGQEVYDVPTAGVNSADTHHSLW
jgi:hypothetical protein